MFTMSKWRVCLEAAWTASSASNRSRLDVAAGLRLTSPVAVS